MAVGIEELGGYLKEYEEKVTFLGDGVPVFGGDLEHTIMNGKKKSPLRQPI